MSSIEQSNFIMSGKLENVKRMNSEICGKRSITKGFNHRRKYKSSKDLIASSHDNFKQKCFECEECGKKYVSRIFYWRHIVEHNAQRNCEKETNLTIDSEPDTIEKKKCHICVKMCNPQSLEQHICSHLNTKYFSCKECKSQFSTKKLLMQHVDTHSNQYVCEICNKKFRNAHKQKHHTCILKSYICATCGKGFIKPSCLKIHMRTHTKEAPYLCDTCGRRFMHKYNLKMHYRKHLKENVGSVDGTGTGHTSNKVLESHGEGPHIQLKPLSKKKLRRELAKQQITCDICGKIIRKNIYERHLRSHTNEKPYICDICPKAFKLKSKLDSHNRSHSDLISSFHCDICDKTFTHKRSLYFHYQTHKQKTFRCQFCDKSFVRKIQLKVHVSLHTGEKPFRCEECNKSFVNKYGLQRHEEIHKEPKYICSICKKAFRQKSNRDQHLNVHIKPYTCDICHKSFSELKSLKNHYLWHTSLNVSFNENSNASIIDEDSELNDSETSNNFANENERTHICSVCKTVFLKEEDLTHHQNVFMENKNYKCCACLQVYSNEIHLFEHQKDHNSSLVNRNISSSDKPSKLIKKVHECKVCKKTFETESCLGFHEKEFFREGNYKCCMCLQVYGEQNCLLQHLIEHIASQIDKTLFVSNQLSELEDKTYECRICKNNFLNESSFLCHIDEFSNKDRLRCCKCLQLFGSCKDLLEHYKSHNTLLIEEDDSSFNTISESEKKSMCNAFNKVFPDTNGSECHNNKFLKEDNFKCSMCQQVFSDNKSLLDHCNVHNNVNNMLLRTFMPSVLDCDKSLRKENYLDSNKTELENKSNSCEVCTKVFSNSMSLKSHTDKFFQEGSFRCCVCNQVFSDKKILLEHCNIHDTSVAEITLTNSRMYSKTDSQSIFCEICKQNFQNRAILKQHKNEFTQEGNYKCCLCHKEYSMKAHLLNHHKMHEVSTKPDSTSCYNTFFDVEKVPHLCKICGNEFSNEAMLFSHNEENVQKENFKCCMCKEIYSSKEILFEHHKVHKELTENPYISFLKAAN